MNSDNYFKPQAIRTLQLLEQHHKRLAQILRFQHEHPPTTGSGEPTPLSQPSVSSPAVDPNASKPLGQDIQPQPPRLPGHTRQIQRETTSIASNLASARGIPANLRRAAPVSPTLSAQHAGAQLTDSPSKQRGGDLRQQSQTSPRNRSNRMGTPRQPLVPPPINPTDIASQQMVAAEVMDASSSRKATTTFDEPFQRFYSTFEGLISKLSAPLAFAGLPLGTELISPEDRARQKSPAETKVIRQNATQDKTTAPVEPDVNKLFSRAALRAIRDTNGLMPGGTAESFYVVPTTGGTVSYAGILSRAGKEARRSSLGEEDEDFVDARETPSSPEMLASFQGAKSKNVRGSEKGNKTLEELQMENQALKHLSDTLSKRLHMWEVNAQSSSMALQQSLKAIHAASPTASAAPSTPLGGTSSNEARIKELEDRLRRGEKELERTNRENEKLKEVLGRYRDRWEKLKEGAKTRREANFATASPSPRADEPDANPKLTAAEGGSSEDT